MRESTFTLVYWGFIPSFPTKGQLDYWGSLKIPLITNYLPTVMIRVFMKPGNLGCCFGPVSTASSWRKPDKPDTGNDKPKKRGGHVVMEMCCLGGKTGVPIKIKGANIYFFFWGGGGGGELIFKLLFIVFFSLWFQLIPQKTLHQQKGRGSKWKPWRMDW